MDARPTRSDEFEERLRDAMAQWGVESRARLAILSALGSKVTIEELVDLTGLTPGEAKRVVSTFDPWVERDGDRLTLRSVNDRLERVTASHSITPPDHEIDEFMRLRPPADRSRDHVSATASTLQARVEFLTERFFQAGSRMIFLGDRDMTALALSKSASDVALDVVDVDDDVLAAVRSRADTNVGLWFADLRIGLPEALCGTADIVFTDPP